MSDNDALVAALGKQGAIDLEQMTVDDHDDDWGESMLWMYNQIRRLSRELAAERQVSARRAVVDSADPPPVSAIEIRLSIGAETEERLIEVVEDLTRRWRTENGVRTSLWGGAGSNGHIEVSCRDISPEDYRSELGEWFERQRLNRIISAAGGSNG